MSKYKYYFRKPRSEIAKDILVWAALGSMVAVAGGFASVGIWQSQEQWQKYPRKKFVNTFSRMRRNGLLEVQRKKYRVYVGLTEEGRKAAGRLQIDSLEIKRPKKWDGKWRVLAFDIAQLKKFERDAFRGKLRELGFYQFQKSLWICPFECSDEIEVLKEFFELDDDEVRLIVAEKIGDDRDFKDFFKL